MTSRKDLDFAREAEAQFGFLVNRYEFEVTSCSNTEVRYESRKVFLEIFHGVRDYEIGINFGRIGMGEHFSFLMFCRLKKIEEVTSQEMISDEVAQIKKFLRILAKALEEKGLEIVEGNGELFEKMKSVRWWDFDPRALRKGVGEN